MKKLILLLLVVVISIPAAVTYAAPVNYTYWTVDTAFPDGGSVIASSTIDKKVFHSGQGSMRLTFGTETAPGHYIFFRQTGNSNRVDLSKTYIIEFWAKAQNASGVTLRWDWEVLESLSAPLGTYDWTYFKYEVRPTVDTVSFGVLVEAPTVGFWIDDISVRLKDEDGLPTGANLIYNGSFADEKYTAPANVSNVSVVEGDTTIELSWTNPTASDYDSANVYSLNEDGTETFIQTVGKANNSVVLEGLVNRQLYKFLLKSSDTFENESAGIFTFGVPKYSEIVVQNRKISNLNSGGTIITENLTNLEEGRIKAFADLTNYGAESITGELIMVLYKGDTLVDATSSFKTVGQDVTEGFTAELEVPDVSAGNYRLFVYLWKSIGNMEPLAELSNIN